MGRVFNQFPSCSFPAAALILTVPKLSTFKLTQFIHPKHSCYNTGIPQSPAFTSQGSSKASLSCWPALESGLVGAHGTHTEHVTTCPCETEAGVIWTPTALTVILSGTSSSPNCNQILSMTRGSACEQAGTKFLLYHTRGFFSSDVGLRGSSGSSFNHVEICNHTTSAGEALHVLPKKNIQINTVYLKK